MSDSFNRLPLGTGRFDGYSSDPSNSPVNYLSFPSQNCLITEEGKVEQRRGYKNEFSIGVDGSAATAIYHSTYDIAFFALGTKLFYRDFTNNATYDTGIALTAGTTTRFAEFNGDIYLTNTTDGIYRIMCTRVNDTSANAGDGTITLDSDGAARLSVFGDTTGNIRINGVNETFNAVVVSTGVLTIPGNLVGSYSDNAVAIFVDGSYSSLEKASKILFWKSRMHIMGFPSATNADQPNNTVMAGQFVIGQTGAAGIELIVDFTFGTGGSTKITVGGGGKLTSILSAKDFIWFFTEGKAFATYSGDVNAETPSESSPGSALGLTIPVEKDGLHGCINEDCATVMGDSAVTYVDYKRIFRIPIATDTGAPVSPVEEDFDVDIRDHLKNMDRDQTGSFAYHYRGGRQTIYQLKISGQWFWFIFDHNIIRSAGSNFVRGAWQPPQRIIPVKSLFERSGVLYGTDISDDTVYSFFTAFNDNQAPINCIIATGEFNVGQAMMGKAKLNGEINYPSEINIRCYVWNETRGKRSGSPKVIYGSSYNYSDNQSVGAVPVGDGGITPTVSIAKWNKEFDIFPAEAHRAQLVLENRQDGGYFSLSSFGLTGTQYTSSFSSSI